MNIPPRLVPRCAKTLGRAGTSRSAAAPVGSERDEMLSQRQTVLAAADRSRPNKAAGSPRTSVPRGTLATPWACQPLLAPDRCGAGRARSLAHVGLPCFLMPAGLRRLATRKDCRYTLPCFARAAAFWARSSAVEHYLDMVGVTGSIPVAPTIQRPTERHRVMKVRNSLKSLRGRHRANRLVRRKGRVYIINKTNRRFKARQG